MPPALVLPADPARATSEPPRPDVAAGLTAPLQRFAAGSVSLLAVLLFSARAFASPGGLNGILAFGQEILDFLAGPLAIVALGIGLAIFAYGLMFQRQDAMGGAVRWCIAGVILFSIDSIVGWLQQSST